jgi:hypothetical protein
MGPLTAGERKAITRDGALLRRPISSTCVRRDHGPVRRVARGSDRVARWGVLQCRGRHPALLIFSAGAAGGLALDDTGAAEWAVQRLFGGFALDGLPFGVAYTIVMAVMMYSHLLTTSKTVRTMIMIPIIISLSKALGWDPVSLALPAALCIDWVVGLPISGKPNVIMFSTNQYSVIENFKYGMVTCTIGLLLLVLSAATWFHWLSDRRCPVAHPSPGSRLRLAVLTVAVARVRLNPPASRVTLSIPRLGKASLEIVLDPIDGAVAVIPFPFADALNPTLSGVPGAGLSTVPANGQTNSSFPARGTATPSRRAGRPSEPADKPRRARRAPQLRSLPRYGFVSHCLSRRDQEALPGGNISSAVWHMASVCGGATLR